MPRCKCDSSKALPTTRAVRDETFSAGDFLQSGAARLAEWKSNWVTEGGRMAPDIARREIGSRSGGSSDQMVETNIDRLTIASADRGRLLQNKVRWPICAMRPAQRASHILGAVTLCMRVE